jgi:hypothetical protein
MDPTSKTDKQKLILINNNPAPQKKEKENDCLNVPPQAASAVRRPWMHAVCLYVYVCAHVNFCTVVYVFVIFDSEVFLLGVTTMLCILFSVYFQMFQYIGNSNFKTEEN